jgi:hypothetical protein
MQGISGPPFTLALTSTGSTSDQRFAPGEVRQGTIVDDAKYFRWNPIHPTNTTTTTDTDATLKIHRELGSESGA